MLYVYLIKEFREPFLSLIPATVVISMADEKGVSIAILIKAVIPSAVVPGGLIPLTELIFPILFGNKNYFHNDVKTFSFYQLQALVFWYVSVKAVTSTSSFHW